MWSLHRDRPLRMTSTEGCGPSGSGGYCVRNSLVSARFWGSACHAAMRRSGPASSAMSMMHRSASTGTDTWASRVIMSR